MTLFSNEKTILSSNENKIILTNLRLYMSDKEWGQSYSNTIFLEDISSLETRYKSNIIFIAIGGLLLMGWFYRAMFSYSSSGASFLFILAIVFFLLYWFTRRHVVSITPNGGRPINFVVSNMKTERIEDFVSKVQIAKLQRRIEIYKL